MNPSDDRPPYDPAPFGLPHKAYAPPQAAPPPPPPPAAPPPSPIDQRLRARNERLKLTADSFDLAGQATRAVVEAQQEGLQHVRALQETAMLQDAIHKDKAAALLELSGMIAEGARRAREQWEQAPPPAPKKGFWDVADKAMEHAVPSLFDWLKGGGGAKVLAAVSSLAPGLGEAIGAAAEGAASEAQGTAAAGGAAAPAPAASSPGAPAQPNERMPDIGVLWREVPPEVAEHLTLGELRRLAEEVAKHKAQGGPFNVDSLINLMRQRRA